MPEPSREEVIEWLWTEEGMHWSASEFTRIRHQTGPFGQIKRDHECLDECVLWEVHTDNGYTRGYTNQIRQDIDKYGLAGLPS